MKLALVAPLVAALGFGGARVARVAAQEREQKSTIAGAYAPSPGAAPFLSLGFRELAADLFYVRWIAYFSTENTQPAQSAALAEAIVALDPTFRRAYEFGAIALTDARMPPDQANQLRAIALLEKGIPQFPSYWRLASLAGQIYIGDLQTTDPAQRRAWDERGALLLESASRKPGAPPEAALQAATLQTRLGKQQRAIQNLREMFMLTDDARARDAIVKQLAKLEAEAGDDIASEILAQRQEFQKEWHAARPSVPATFYILLGKPLGAAFDLTDLAAGGDLIGTQGFSSIPANDATSEAGPSSP